MLRFQCDNYTFHNNICNINFSLPDMEIDQSLLENHYLRSMNWVYFLRKLFYRFVLVDSLNNVLSCFQWNVNFDLTEWIEKLHQKREILRTVLDLGVYPTAQFKRVPRVIEYNSRTV